MRRLKIIRESLVIWNMSIISCIVPMDRFMKINMN